MDERIEVVELDGDSLQIETLMKIYHRKCRVKLSPEAEERITKSRAVLEKLMTDPEKASVYGACTGVGKFVNTIIPPEKRLQLQENLILSHSVGVGDPLPPERVRALMALRINVHAKGCSGISLDTVQKFIDALNASCFPRVPEKGTVGASGDLAPLAHVSLGLMGIGEMWSPETGWGKADEVLRAHKLTPIKFKEKEGLAAINGTQMITALTAEALHRAEVVSRQADVIAALTIEALLGTNKAFDPRIHQQRCHPGQQHSASIIRALLLNESEFRGDQQQDAYSLRCVPQVHGVTADTLKFVRGIIETEMNSATDNPMIFVDEGDSCSGGNFHGEYPGKAADYLAIAIHEIANMSVMRTDRLLNDAYSKGLPLFLVPKDNDCAGLNSGFMIIQYTAAALVSENKVLTHPSTVDSISTSAGTEDHVSMGGFAARKALQVVSNVEHVMAIELIVACQAIDLRQPKKLSGPLRDVYDIVRKHISTLDKDRFMGPDIEAAVTIVKEGQIWDAVVPHLSRQVGSKENPSAVVPHLARQEEHM